MSVNQEKNDLRKFAVDLNDPAEIRYLKAMLTREFAAASTEQINGSVEVCRQHADPFASRKELLQCARKHLLDHLNTPG